MSSQIKVPEVLNPTVESTVITDDPIETSPITFLFPGMVKYPSIRSCSFPES